VRFPRRGSNRPGRAQAPVARLALDDPAVGGDVAERHRDDEQRSDKNRRRQRRNGRMKTGVSGATALISASVGRRFSSN
jgi:hypothetical protein